MPKPTTATESPPPTDVILVSISDAEKMLSLSKRHIYNLLDRGLLESRYIGRRRLLLADSVKAFAHGLPDERVEG